MWKQLEFFNHRSYIKKSTWQQRGLFDGRNYIEKSTWKQGGFFRPLKLHRKKYVEAT